MAGAGYKLFQTGDVLTAAQVNTYLNEQTVMVFANAAARTSALTSVLAEGMVSYLQDTNAVEVYNGSAWVGVSGAGDVTEVQAGTGISVANGTGPIPIVTNTVATAFDSAGDLVYGTGADTFTKLGIGTAGQVLKVNSGATAPEWGVAGGGMTLLSTTSLTGSSVTISTISQDYVNLFLILEDVVPATDDVNLLMRVNGATGSVYTNSNTMSNFESNTTTGTSIRILDAVANNANDWCNVQINIPNYTAAYYKYFTTFGFYANKNMDAVPSYYTTASHISAYLATTAISSITFFFASGNFSTGSVKIYGVK